MPDAGDRMTLTASFFAYVLCLLSFAFVASNRAWQRPVGVLRRSSPLQRHADVSRSSAGEVDDLDPQLVSTIAEIFCPKLIDFFRHAGERVFPPRLLLIDSAPLVGADHVREPIHLNLGLAVGNSPLD